ncbi:MAG: hypothetical protein ACMUEL_04495 [Flavobacteriales bacterium Tduv]
MTYIWNVLPEGFNLQKVNYLDPLERDEEGNKENISKRSGN